MRDRYTGSSSEKLDWDEEAIKERAAQRDKADEEISKLSKEKQTNYEVQLPLICKQTLESEIKRLEGKISMIPDEKEREWRMTRMLNIIKDFLMYDCVLYSSEKTKDTEKLNEECEKRRQMIRDVAYENNED